MRRASKVFASIFLLVLFAAAPASASTVSDFQARLAQTHWNIQALEGLVKAQRASARAVPTPEAIESFLQLLAENVAALNVYAAAKVTDEQGRVIAEGLRSAATQLRDLGSVSGHRGLSAAASEVSRLEMTCRLALPDTN